MKENDEKLTIVEGKLEKMSRDIEEMKKSIKELLKWANEVSEIESYRRRNMPRIVALNPKDNTVDKEHARYYVESGGKRTYY